MSVSSQPPPEPDERDHHVLMDKNTSADQRPANRRAREMSKAHAPVYFQQKRHHDKHLFLNLVIDKIQNNNNDPRPVKFYKNVYAREKKQQNPKKNKKKKKQEPLEAWVPMTNDEIRNRVQRWILDTKKNGKKKKKKKKEKAPKEGAPARKEDNGLKVAPPLSESNGIVAVAKDESHGVPEDDSVLSVIDKEHMDDTELYNQLHALQWFQKDRVEKSDVCPTGDSSVASSNEPYIHDHYQNPINDAQLHSELSPRHVSQDNDDKRSYPHPPTAAALGLSIGAHEYNSQDFEPLDGTEDDPSFLSDLEEQDIQTLQEALQCPPVAR